MNRFSYIFLFALSIPLWAFSQNPAPDGDENHVLTRSAKIPVSTATTFESLNLSTESVVQVQYLDGLGRGTQLLDVMGAPDQTDVVQAVVYDEFGRSPRQYLPFNHIDNPSNHGAYIDNPLAKQLDFYDATHLNLTDKPWAEALFEASPLNRVIEQGAAGADWQPGSGHSMRTISRSNTSADQVINFGIHPQPGQTYTSNYPADSLLVQEITDENGANSWTFTDKLGRSILQQQELAGDMVRTYTLYNERGLPVYILQPEGVAKFENSQDYGGANVLSQALLDDFAFQYVYDAKGRVIEKKVPGAGWVHMIYNPLDQIVLSQDSVQRANDQWSFTKYDALERPIITGLFSSSKSRQTIQNDLNSWWNSGYYKLFEVRKSINHNQSMYGYSDRNSYPETWWGTVELHSVSYFDDYDFNFDGDETDADELPMSEPLYGDGEGKLDISSQIWNRVIGKVTGIRTWILDPDPDMPVSMFTRTFYDKYGREIQTVADNHLGGSEQMSYEYNFAGELLYQVHRHTDGNAIETITEEWFTYDHRSRMLRHQHRIDQGAKVILADYEYDELGQVIKEQLHSQDNGAAYLQSIDQRYNVRGWLTDINTVDPTCQGGGEDFATQIDLTSITLSILSTPTSSSKFGPVVYPPDFRMMIQDTKEVNFFDVSSGSTYTQEAPMEVELPVFLHSPAAKSSLPQQITLTFEPAELVVDGQYSAVYNLIQSEINTQYSAFIQANRDTIIEQIYQKIQQELDQIFDHSQQLDLFRMKLRYNEGFSDLYGNAVPQYNGNISGIEWQTPLDCSVKGYAYSYDKLNRLRQARYGEQVSSGGNWNQNLHAYDAQYSYDLNGNFLQLMRNKPNSSGGYDVMDLLQYDSYDGNRLLSVNDLANFPETVGLDQFLDGNNTAPDYSYDGAGNLIQDLNKDIGIRYNHLNKPSEVYELDSSSDQKVSYIYASDGTKLRQKVLDSNDAVTKRTDYAGSFQYEDPDGADTAQQRLSFILHPKGRLLPDQGTLVYQYFLKDHLGNTRVLFGDLDGDGKINPDPLVSNDVDQVADYYPFGLQHGASSVMATPAQNYLYNGKEMQDELGLGWLDYGARMYDASVGRWNGVDALADAYIGWSPYNYTLNNPVRFVDPDGNKPSDPPSIVDVQKQQVPNGAKAVDPGIGKVQGARKVINKMNELAFGEKAANGMSTVYSSTLENVADMVQGHLALDEEGNVVLDVEVGRSFPYANDNIQIVYEGAEFTGEATLTGVNIIQETIEGNSSRNFGSEKAKSLGITAEGTIGPDSKQAKVGGSFNTSNTKSKGSGHGSSSTASFEVTGYIYEANIKHTYTINYLDKGLSHGSGNRSTSVSIISDTQFEVTRPLKSNPKKK
ncbi:MAG: DUF6443 domain-containing protein [Bacteroidota bacterium]